MHTHPEPALIWTAITGVMRALEREAHPGADPAYWTPQARALRKLQAALSSRRQLRNIIRHFHHRAATPFEMYVQDRAVREAITALRMARMGG